ncbi:Nif3-like dinuclear metal center hexameric protein [Pedobacter sp. MC2016-15]|uniref:Nif3-like dinuclear metal center hexameric protein n=1 Tax=Pedobacter sp. MC2016-15 TaxID=2994473 RepID=UPI0022469A43|nr:Nif3-like dinuclear metal center hexameric protein [Pedobacter sp. MC2016-15]MCX2478513.1 Nif3-like dinuclear metal center hexameric protein [Pedobacter sp. MC2016-15]
MRLATLIKHLEEYAPLSYQEDYDNSGLLTGDVNQEITGALVALDCIEEIVDEAIAKGCNLIITHHPIVFKGLKKLTGRTYVERVVLKAIKNNIALYAIHTNLDSVHNGVNGVICKRLGLQQPKILQARGGLLKKLVTFCPTAQAPQLRAALFAAGAGNISAYSDCSFNTEGTGTFKAGDGTQPFVGAQGIQHEEPETRIETIFYKHQERQVLLALLQNHPYEEVAYDIYALENTSANVGSGMVGWLEEEMEASEFLSLVKSRMNVSVIRHTRQTGRKIKKVAVCGGSGSFLLSQAIAAGADAFVTADFKYHEFFDADGKLIIADIGHFESEQFTSDLLIDIIREKFPNFAIRLTEHNTNPINYFI